MMSGISSLTDIELLAIFIRTSYKSDVLTLSAKLLSNFDGINGLANATQKDLMTIRGIGATKSIELIALFEFAKRIFSNENKEEMINEDKQAVMIAHSLFRNFKNEYFVVILLDNQNKLIFKKILYSGTKHEVLIDPKDVLSLALKYDATSIYCFHNHPSGNLIPSEPDIAITRRLENYCNLFGILLRGHFIIREDKCYFPVGI